MLAGLARWLRAAGHDAALGEPGERDRALLERAAAEDRVFVTRDRAVAQIKTDAEVWVLPEAGLEAEAAALGARGVNWLLAPLTRCMVDNTPLRDPRPEELEAEPPSVRDLPGAHRACPACGRQYWPGSHARRISDRLERWAAAEAVHVQV